MKEAKSIADMWLKFQNKFQLNTNQVKQFKHYSALLSEWNKKINLTAITEENAIIGDHFEDSIILSKYVDFKTISMIADVGTGAGFPAIPLKICYPHLKVALIEVIQKKITFLKTLVDHLELPDVVISSLDWRTFLRQTDYPIDLFCARAALSVDELIRIFKPSSPYQKTQLVYWASRDYHIPDKIKPFVYRQETYTINDKQRRYIFLQKKG